MTVKVDRSLLGSRSGECEAVCTRLGPLAIFKRSLSAQLMACALEAGQSVAHMLLLCALGSYESNEAILDLDQELLEAIALGFEPASCELGARLLLRRYLNSKHGGLSVLTLFTTLFRQSLDRYGGKRLVHRGGDAWWLILFVFRVHHYALCHAAPHLSVICNEATLCQR